MAQELTLADTAHYERMHEVVTLHLEGHPANWIAKNLKLKHAEVVGFINDFKEIAKSDDLLRARAQEVVHEFDQTMNRVTSELWGVADDVEIDLKTKSSTLKSIAEVSAKRVEVIQKAGLLSDAALGDEMAELEDRQDKLMAILREVTAHCNHCKFEVAQRLTAITGKVETVTVVSDRE